MWAAARSPIASGYRSIGKFKPFLNADLVGLAWRDEQMSSYANTPVCIFVQERLPEMPDLFSLIPAGARYYINLRV
jgi:hypothetical protein